MSPSSLTAWQLEMGQRFGARLSTVRLLVTLAMVVLMVSVPNLGQAQELGVDQAKVSISPTLFELSAKPGDVLDKTMKIINTSDVIQTYEMEIVPFVGNELGQAKIITGDGTTFPLKDWIKITPMRFTLTPQQTQLVKFSIIVPTNAEPGGQYGALLAWLNNQSDVSGTGAVTRTKVGSLVLIAIAGDINYSAFVKDFSVAKKRFEHSPIAFTTRIHNNSTVHIKPKGFITLTNIFGHKVGSLDFEQKNIFPATDRLITQSYDQPLPIGRYVASLNLLYGERGDQLSAKLVFYVLPLWLIISSVLLLLLIILLLTYRKRQKRKIAQLLKAAKTPRIIRRMG